MQATRIDIWHIPLSQGPFSTSEQILSEAEQARAERFANRALRKDFLRTHTAKRQILAQYLGVAAKDLAFTTNRYGKPCLAGATAATEVRFNLSHTRSSTVMAVTHGYELGIDIEALDRSVTALPLARRYFSAQVLEHLGTLDENTQRETFLRYWTQFEAYKKARGDGLRGDENKLAFNLATAPENHFESLPFNTPVTPWQVAELDYLPGFAISVVVAGNPQPLELHWQTCT